MVCPLYRGCPLLRGSNRIILIGRDKFGDLVSSIVERYLIQCLFLGGSSLRGSTVTQQPHLTLWLTSWSCYWSTTSSSFSLSGDSIGSLGLLMSSLSLTLSLSLIWKVNDVASLFFLGAHACLRVTYIHVYMYI